MSLPGAFRGVGWVPGCHTPHAEPFAKEIPADLRNAPLENSSQSFQKDLSPCPGKEGVLSMLQSLSAVNLPKILLLK